jgi:hypothetical protein
VSEWPIPPHPTSDETAPDRSRIRATSPRRTQSLEPPRSCRSPSLPNPFPSPQPPCPSPWLRSAPCPRFPVRSPDCSNSSSLPPPRPTCSSVPPGLPRQVYLARRGRGVRREAADPPSSLSPGGKPRKHPTAGRRPVALREETHGAKQMEGNTRRETQGGKHKEGNRCPVGGQLLLLPAPALPLPRHSTSASSTEVRPQRLGRGVDGPVCVVAPGRPRPSD